MNKVILMGRLTRDPDIRYAQSESQMAIARYTLAVDRRMRRSQDGASQDQQTADFIGCVAFGRSAEFAEKYLRQGRIQTGSYTNKEGQKVYTTDVVVENQEFAESKNASAGNGGNYSANRSYGQQSHGGQQSSAAIGDGFMNIPDGVEDEGLPFN